MRWDLFIAITAVLLAACEQLERLTLNPPDAPAVTPIPAASPTAVTEPTAVPTLALKPTRPPAEEPTKDGTRRPPAERPVSDDPTLAQLKELIREIRRQSRLDPQIVVEPKESGPEGKIDVTEPGPTDPPKGASHYEELDEKRSITVRSKSLRVSRDEPKTAPDLNSPPESPKEWFQLGFAGNIYRPEPGVDKRLFRAAEVIKDRDFTYGFIILNEYLSDEVGHKLQGLGVELMGPHATAHKVKIPLDNQVIKSLGELSFVEWLGYSPPRQKLDLLLQRVAKRYGQDLEAFPVIINFFDQQSVKRYQDRLRKQGIVLGRSDSDNQSYTAVLPREQFKWLAHQDYVLYVELESTAFSGHDESMAAMGVDYIRSGGGGTNFTGSSTILGILDTGFMLGSSAPTMHRNLNKNGCGKNFTSDSAGVWNNQNSHGTHVLGTIIGTGTADSRYRGVATGVGSSSSTRVRAAKVWDSTGSGSSSFMNDAMDYMDNNSACDSGRPKVINISGGSTGSAKIGTGSTSRKLDANVWDHGQAYIVCGGNSGSTSQTIWSPGVAKNALAVGNALDSGYQTIGDISGSSSRGSTGDGRMKPNIVGSGTTVTSADAGTTSSYDDKSGCSIATPHVSRIAATVLDHYSTFGDRPYLLRSHLMATAILHNDDTTPSDNDSGGRNTYGLGRVSTYAAHWARSNSNGWNTHWGKGTITSSTWGDRDIDVPDGTDRLVVVMTWDEDSASSGASAAVDYDLDLWIDRDADCTPDSKGQCGEWASQS